MSARKPSRKVVRHNGRTTTAKPRRVLEIAGTQDLTMPVRHAVQRAQMRSSGQRLQQLVDASPEAAAAMRRLGAQLGVADDPDMAPEFDVHVSADPAACSHPSASGIDMTSPADPAKVWRCDACGFLYRSMPDGTGAHRVEPVT